MAGSYALCGSLQVGQFSKGYGIAMTIDQAMLHEAVLQCVL